MRDYYIIFYNSLLFIRWIYHVSYYYWPGDAVHWLYNLLTLSEEVGFVNYIDVLSFTILFEYFCKYVNSTHLKNGTTAANCYLWSWEKVLQCYCTGKDIFISASWEPVCVIGPWCPSHSLCGLQYGRVPLYGEHRAVGTMSQQPWHSLEQQKGMIRDHPNVAYRFFFRTRGNIRQAVWYRMAGRSWKRLTGLLTVPSFRLLWKRARPCSYQMHVRGESIDFTPLSSSLFSLSLAPSITPQFCPSNGGSAYWITPSSEVTR